jgi:hypothetical protein
MATNKSTTQQTPALASDATGLSILFDSIARLTNDLEGELAERSEHLSTALRCMAERGSAAAEALAGKLTEQPTG